MTDGNGDMITNAVDPLVLEIFLYKNNYKDRLLISELKEKAQTIKIPGLENGSFFVKTDDIIDILNTKFKKDLDNFESTPSENLNQSVTSIYFIDSIIQAFGSIRYFRINVSESEVYSRKTKDSISFEFRILHSKIDLTSICAPDFLIEARRILKKLGFISPESFTKTPYFEASARDLVNKLRSYSQMINPEGEESEYVSSLLLIFGNKLEKDNSIILVITEE